MNLSAGKVDIEAAREGQPLPDLFGAADALQMAAPAATLPQVDVLGDASKLSRLSSATSMCFPAAFPFATAASRLSSATSSCDGFRYFRFVCPRIKIL